MSLLNDPPQAEALERLTATNAHLFAVIPWRVSGELLTVACVQTLEDELRTPLEEITRCALKQEQVGEDELLAALAQHYGPPQVSEVPVVNSQGQPLPGFDALATAPAPVIRICRKLIILGTDREVASMFLLPHARGATVRATKLNSQREEERLQTTFLAQCVVRQLKAFAGVDTAAPAPQSGTLEVTGLARDFKLVIETYENDGFECVRVEVID